MTSIRTSTPMQQHPKSNLFTISSSCTTFRNILSTCLTSIHQLWAVSKNLAAVSAPIIHKYSPSCILIMFCNIIVLISTSFQTNLYNLNYFFLSNALFASLLRLLMNNDYFHLSRHSYNHSRTFF